MAAANTLRTQMRDGGAGARLAAEARLADLRQKLRNAVAQKKTRMREFVEACKEDRRTVREHVKEMRDRALRELSAQIQVARGAAKITRLTRLAEVNQAASAPVLRARAATTIEKLHQAELARLEREERSRRGEIRHAHERAIAANALRSSIFGKLAPLFEREARAIKQAPGESRGEALLRFAEKNPEKAHAVLEPVIHRKIEETARAVAEAERAVRAVGGDVRAGVARPKNAEARAESDHVVREHAAPPADAKPATPSFSEEHAKDNGKAAVSAKPATAKKSAKVAKKRAPARGRSKSLAARTNGAPGPAAAVGTPTERRKGQLSRGGPGVLLSDLLRERAEIAAARTAARSKRASGKTSSRAGTVVGSPPAVVPALPAPSYAAWCDLLKKAARKHQRRVAFGPETHDAWKSGQDPEAFVQSLPGMGGASAISRHPLGNDSVNLHAPVANRNAPETRSAESPKLALVTSAFAAQVKPYKVRASCGHIVVRKMREATAGVPYSETVVLEAPNGRACDACEAKKGYGVHAPNPAPKKDVKAPELRDTAQIAKRIRADIHDAVRAKKLPKGTYSVKTSKYSMGSSIKVVASKLGFPVLNPEAFRVDADGKSISHDRAASHSRHTPKADAVLATLSAIVDAYHWDRSDLRTDYHHSRFSRDVVVDEGDEWKRLKEQKIAEKKQEKSR